MRSGRPCDLLGVGIGPFNLSLAALLEPVEEVEALFVEQKPRFDWHPGLLMEGTTLQVPFLADLVTMADPTSPHSFLNYLREQGRLYNFYFLERFHVPRREYEHYCRWVAERLPSCRFGERVEGVRHAGDHFEVSTRKISTGERRTRRARHLALGVGTAPQVPACFEGKLGEDAFHSADYLPNRERCMEAASVTVVGSGQSAAEVFYDLLCAQAERGFRLDWLTRSKGFFPMEYSKLGLEHFSPEYIRYFHGLPQKKRDEVRGRQDLLYKGIDVETIAGIYDLLYERSVGGARPDVRLMALAEVGEAERTGSAWQLHCRQTEQDRYFVHETEVVVLATGYAYRVPGFLEGVRDLIRWDGRGRYAVSLDYRLEKTAEVANEIFVQNGEIHTHGVGAPDLGLGAHRSAVIANQLAGRAVYPVRERNVFQQFGVA
ncbi:L-lysine 6-monooxygenase (NADPH) [Rubrobacter xylanophilus DSM 9941]|uniref:L-lysine N6-monooxygenase MbtG n=1 Tax=Rubrobacter xylanophilus (strain DSM 9941 / JCM 11954 / NBRC 16129 / PRD-1) TaxID=266117 RepID=Q1AYZ5_RUBXD|nr:lysine N(6)-hydroxylase/L-ornithine N(5)-oxygenase family protein [Rubrobacter xylanophilus]ABG03383.1 L-lysine 6-monooxygenase (NADPH) [Rubrobacter xylanophilus DSM 9941]